MGVEDSGALIECKANVGLVALKFMPLLEV